MINIKTLSICLSHTAKPQFSSAELGGSKHPLVVNNILTKSSIPRYVRCPECETLVPFEDGDVLCPYCHIPSMDGEQFRRYTFNDAALAKMLCEIVGIHATPTQKEGALWRLGVYGGHSLYYSQNLTQEQLAKLQVANTVVISGAEPKHLDSAWDTNVVRLPELLYIEDGDIKGDLEVLYRVLPNPPKPTQTTKSKSGRVRERITYWAEYIIECLIVLQKSKYVGAVTRPTVDEFHEWLFKKKKSLCVKNVRDYYRDIERMTTPPTAEKPNPYFHSEFALIWKNYEVTDFIFRYTPKKLQQIFDDYRTKLSGDYTDGNKINGKSPYTVID